jgi:hypothetical protein
MSPERWRYGVLVSDREGRVVSDPSAEERRG